MPEQASKDIREISKDLSEEAKALGVIHDQGLGPEDQTAWNELVAGHKAKHAENRDAIEAMLLEDLSKANGERRRIEEMDHNAR